MSKEKTASEINDLPKKFQEIEDILIQLEANLEKFEQVTPQLNLTEMVNINPKDDEREDFVSQSFKMIEQANLLILMSYEPKKQ